jgi:hypothetical protein
MLPGQTDGGHALREKSEEPDHDTSLIQHTGLNRQECAKRLEALIASERLGLQEGGRPAQWANESVALVKAAWVPDGTDLDEGYYQREIKVVDRQMALAGLRLARLLEETIGKTTPMELGP